MSIDDPNILVKDPEKSRDFLNHVLGTTPEPEPKPADGKHLEGQEVVVHGLKAKPELNGQRGVGLKWNAETRRIGVQIEGVGKVSVRAENVRLPNAADAAVRDAEAAAEKEKEAAEEEVKSKFMVELTADFNDLRAALGETEGRKEQYKVEYKAAEAEEEARVAAAAAAADQAPADLAPPLAMLETNHERATRAGCAVVEPVAVRPDDMWKDEDGVAHRKPARPLPSSATAKAITKILRTGTVDPRPLVDALELWNAEPLLTQSLDALANMSQGNLPGKRELLKFGSAAAAVAAMDKHANAPPVLASGARMLANLANGDAECKKAALEAGIVRVAVAAMRAHPADLMVQQMATGALANIANGDAACQKAMMAGGGPKAVAAALKKFPAAIEIQQQGCLALANLAAGGPDRNAAAGREMVVDVGGPAAAVRAYRTLGVGAPEVRQWALGLLANVASGDADCKQAVADAGGVALLATAMETHRDDAGLQRMACGAIAHVAQDDEARAAVLASAAPTALVRAMRAHVADAAVQTEACFALVQLAWGGGAEGKRAAIEAGAMGALAIALATHTAAQHHKLQQMARAIMEELDKAR